MLQQKSRMPLTGLVFCFVFMFCPTHSPHFCSIHEFLQGMVWSAETGLCSKQFKTDETAVSGIQNWLDVFSSLPADFALFLCFVQHIVHIFVPFMNSYKEWFGQLKQGFVQNSLRLMRLQSQGYRIGWMFSLRFQQISIHFRTSVFLSHCLLNGAKSKSKSITGVSERIKRKRIEEYCYGARFRLLEIPH